MLHVGDSFTHNKYGLYEVVSYSNANKVCIRFAKTGYIATAAAKYVRAGKVFDSMYPSVCGVGYLGDGEHRSMVNGKKSKMYRTWHNMLNRCYSDAYKETHKTYKGCSVCSEWHNYQNYANWHIDNYPNDGASYQLDKDILIHGNKIYSPDTCLFVSAQQNVEKSRAKTYKFISPDGEVVEIYNLEKFSAANGLYPGHMCCVAKGSRKSHKGWTSYQ